jgi:non-heme chloroperoxidase
MLKKTIVTLSAIVIIIFLLIQWQVYKINHAHAAYTFEELNQPMNGKETFIEGHDGVKLRAIVGSEGSKTVILAHGFAGNLEGWNMVFNELVKSGFRVIAFDQRGHSKSTIGTDGISSKSMANDYKTILEHFDVKDGILVGHSMGGFLSIKFMLDYPEIAQNRLHGTLLMSTLAGDLSRDNSQNQTQISLIKNGWIQTVMANESLATLFQSTFIGTPYKAIIQTALQSSKSQDLVILTPILEALVDENYYPQLNQIKTPCVVMVGTADKSTPSFHSEDLIKGIANARLVKVEGKGHLLNWEAHLRIVEEIKKMSEN